MDQTSKYISQLTPQDVEGLIVVLSKDDKERPALLIRSSSISPDKKIEETSSLILITNVGLGIAGSDGKAEVFHALVLKNTSDAFLSYFSTAAEFIQRSCPAPVSKEQILVLFGSIKELFQTEEEKEKAALQIGVFGELLVLRYLDGLGLSSIYDMYHDDFFSKHDIEVNKNTRIEVKTSIKESRVHRFDHNQIFRNDVRVFVASSLLEKTEDGLTLFDLFGQVEEKVHDANKFLFLEKLKKRCGVDSKNPGLCVSEEKAYQDLRFFRAEDLPHLVEDNPLGVTNVSYDVDCSRSNALDETAIHEIFVAD
jgi:hypothetical protein